MLTLTSRWAKKAQEIRAMWFSFQLPECQFRCKTQIASPVFRAFLDVKACLNAILEGYLGYGKSPYFRGVSFLWVLGPDWLVYNLMVDNGAKYLD